MAAKTEPDAPPARTNYRVEVGSVGEYKLGDVVPAVALAGHRVEGLVAMNAVTPTDDPVTVTLSSAPPPVTAAVEGEFIAEMDKLRRDNAALVAENKALAARDQDRERQLAAMKDEVARYVDENSRLRSNLTDARKDAEAAGGEAGSHRAAAEGAQAENQQLKADLEQRSRELEAARAELEQVRAEQAEAQQAEAQQHEPKRKHR